MVSVVAYWQCCVSLWLCGFRGPSGEGHARRAEGAVWSSDKLATLSLTLDEQ